MKVAALNVSGKTKNDAHQRRQAWAEAKDADVLVFSEWRPGPEQPSWERWAQQQGYAHPEVVFEAHLVQVRLPVAVVQVYHLGLKLLLGQRPD